MDQDILQIKFNQALLKIKSCENALLITHEHPDGDALSSVCAVSLLLDDLGKKHTLFCVDEYQKFYNFLPNINRFTKIIPENFENYDLIIIFDCGSIKRTGIAQIIKEKKTEKQYLIEFDHHVKIENYSDLEIRTTNKSSTSEILYYFFKSTNITITKKIANCILTGILTDTANFLWPTTSMETINISSAMLSFGADFPKITQKTLQNKNIVSMKTLGKVLDNLEINKKYDIAYSVLTFEEITELKREIEDDDIFEMINGFLSNMKDVKAIMFLREEKIGRIKGSLRTNNSKNQVLDLAKLLGGGGHPRACGFEIDGHLEKTENSWKII